MIIVSACLAGMDCRYDGKSNEVEEIKKLVEDKRAIIICPEQLGGMPTPRIPCEMRRNDGEIKIVSMYEENFTEKFVKGAEEALKIAKMYDSKIAILKAKSPSCGAGKIYDGTFQNKLIEGNGICAKLFIENEIRVYTEEDIEKLDLKKL